MPFYESRKHSPPLEELACLWPVPELGLAKDMPVHQEVVSVLCFHKDKPKSIIFDSNLVVSLGKSHSSISLEEGAGGF